MDALSMKGKPNATTWLRYFEVYPSILECVIESTGWRKDVVHVNVAVIGTLLSQRVHVVRKAAYFDLYNSDDVITITDSWLTREQCMAIKCILEANYYPCVVRHEPSKSTGLGPQE